VSSDPAIRSADVSARISAGRQLIAHRNASVPNFVGDTIDSFLGQTGLTETVIELQALASEGGVTRHRVLAAMMQHGVSTPYNAGLVVGYGVDGEPAVRIDFDEPGSLSLAWSTNRGPRMQEVPAAESITINPAPVTHRMWLTHEYAATRGFLAGWTNCEFANRASSQVWGSFLVRNDPRFVLKDVTISPTDVSGIFDDGAVESIWRRIHRQAVNEGFAAGIPLFDGHGDNWAEAHAIFISEGDHITWRDVPKSEFDGGPEFSNPSSVISSANRWVNRNVGSSAAGFPTFEQASTPSGGQVYGVMALASGPYLTFEDVALANHQISTPDIQQGDCRANMAAQRGRDYTLDVTVLGDPNTRKEPTSQAPKAGTPMLRHSVVIRYCGDPGGVSCEC
jgi:hypothetical protein